MNRLVFQNIKELLQIRNADVAFVSGRDMQQLPSIKNAYLMVENGKIVDYGTMENMPSLAEKAWQEIDATGKMMLPSWCDSHTHLVYAGNRETEFVDRIKGLSYQEIAQKGGGILNSALKLNAESEEELYEQSSARLAEIISLGTGAVEIKSGYGLTVDGELKMLRVIQQLKRDYPIPIKATFLGAHAIPEAYKDKKDKYLAMLIQQILPTIVNEQLADYIDIFCEEGYFSVKDAELVMAAGMLNGLRAKIHVNQFTVLGGIKAAVQAGALSVDHLEELSDADIVALQGSDTMPVALPGCSYFLGIPYTPARRIIDAGLPIALATDYNPGSAPSGNMNQVVSAACIKMKMTPEEAINAATLNGAYAMELENEMGSITVGKRANLLLTKAIPSSNFIPYAFGSTILDTVYVNGIEQ